MPIVKYEGREIEFVGAYSHSYDCINKGNWYEQPFLEHIRSLGLSGTYLDIGTNIGNHALFFAMFCPSDRVIGFEPMPAWRERALANIRANKLEKKVEVMPLGLLDKPGDIVFNPYGTPHILRCQRLDDVLPEIQNVAFVKMDIEGSEPKALVGARNLLDRCKPLVFAEVIDSPDELLEAAESVGYRHTGKIISGTPMYELASKSSGR